MTADDKAKSKAKDIGDAASDAVDNAADRVQSSAQRLKERAADVSASEREAAADTVASSKRAFDDAAAHAPKSTGEAMDLGSELLTRGNEEVSRLVRDRPFEGLLLAGAIGFLVGWAANQG